MSETPHLSLIYDSAADVESRDVAELHDYWRSKLGGRAMPRPSDVDPADLPHLLPSLVMADYTDNPFRVRYCLVGSTHVHYSGEDFTGRFLDELGWSEKGFVATLHGTMYRTHAPVFGRYEWDFRESLPGFSEFGFFPLSEDGTTVTRGIGLDDYSFFEQQLGRAR